MHFNEILSSKKIVHVTIELKSDTKISNERTKKKNWNKQTKECMELQGYDRTTVRNAINSGAQNWANEMQVKSGKQMLPDKHRPI